MSDGGVRLSSRLATVKPSVTLAVTTAFTELRRLGKDVIDLGGIAVVGGEDFGAPDCIRISYATSMALLEPGMDRLARGLRLAAGAR